MTDDRARSVHLQAGMWAPTRNQIAWHLDVGHLSLHKYEKEISAV